MDKKRERESFGPRRAMFCTAPSLLNLNFSLLGQNARCTLALSPSEQGKGVAFSPLPALALPKSFV